MVYKTDSSRGFVCSSALGPCCRYATFLTLAGLTAAEIATDGRAAAAHLPPVDSVNMLTFLFNGTATSQSPRTEIPLDCTKQGECALIAGDFKLLQVLTSFSTASVFTVL